MINEIEKIAEDVTPPKPVLTLLTLISKVLPEAKLFPQKDLAELAFRDIEKRKMVCMVHYLYLVRLLIFVNLQLSFEVKELIKCFFSGVNDRIVDAKLLFYNASKSLGELTSILQLFYITNTK